MTGCEGLWETTKCMQGPLGNWGKDFNLNSDGQICSLEGSSGCCVNELDRSTPFKRLTNSQANGDVGESVAVRWRNRRQTWERVRNCNSQYDSGSGVSS